MFREKWRKFWTEPEPPRVFWSTFIIYVSLMVVFTYYSWILENKAWLIFLGMLLATGILFPFVYLYKRKKEK